MSYNSLKGLGSHSVRASMHAIYECNDGTSTTLTDSSGNGNDLTWTGAPSVGTEYPPWLSASANSPGSTGTIRAQDTSQLLGATSELSMAGWFRTTNSSGPAIAIGVGGSTNGMCIAWRSGPKTWHASIAQSSTFTEASSTSTAEASGDLVHIAGVVDNTELKIYFNGVLEDTVSTASAGGLPANSDGLCVGYTVGSAPISGSRKNYAGDSSDLFLDTAAFTADEVAALHAGPEPLYIGTALSVNQTATKCEIAGTISWDTQGNGTASTLYQWQVADDAFGTNTQDRGRASTWYPEPGDGSKFVRVSVSGANPSGNVDDAETQTTAWVAITASGVPSTEGRAAIAHNALPVAAGSADFTSPGFGTAAGAIVLMSHSDSSSTIISDYRMSAGYYDFINSVQGVGSTRADDGLSSGDYGWRANLANQFTWQPVTGQRYTISQITDGVRLTWVAGTEPMECTVILLDENVLVESGSLLATDDVFQPTIELPFKGTAAFNMHSCVNSTGTAVTGTLTFGAIDRTGETMWWLGGCARNSYPTSIYGGQGNNGYWARQYNGGAAWSLEANWSTDFYSLELNTIGSPLSDLVPYICLGNITVEVQNRVDQGVAGIQTIPLSLASNPQVAMFFNTLLQSSTAETTGDEAGFFGIGVDDGNTARAYGYLQERNVSTTNMEAVWENDASQSVWVYVSGTGLQSKKAKVNSMNASSIDMDYTTGAGTTRRFGMIVFGEEAAPPASSGNPFINAAFINSIFRNGAY